MSALYTIDVLRLATSLADFPRLSAPDSSVEKRSALCGSRIALDLTFGADGAVSACGFDVRACALGQAAAAVLARGIVGRSAAELGGASAALAAYLCGSRETPGDWPGIAALAPARDYPARHASVRLAFEAAAEAAQVQQAVA